MITKQNIFIALAGIFVTIVGLEIALRLVGYGNVETYTPDQTLLWRLKPNQSTYTKIGNRRVHINSYGMRDDEVSPERLTSRHRILVLGNSCTYGWGVYQDSTYSQVLEQLLNQQQADQFEVLNAGVIGYSISQILEFLKSDGEKWAPDVLLVSHTFNEGKRVTPTSPQEVKDRVFFALRIKNILRNIALYHFVVEFNFSSQYVKLARLVTEDATWIDSTAFNQYQRELQSIIDWSKQRQIETAFLLTVTKNQIESRTIAYSRHQQAFMRIAEENDIPVVNFMEPFRASGHPDLYVDGGHPTEAGHRIMAETIYEQIFLKKSDK